MIPTPWTVLHEVFAGVIPDDMGNDVPSWHPPVEKRVYGWSAPQSEEPKRAGVQSLLVELELYAPAFPVDDLDRFTVNGLVYEVIGEAEDFTHGPFGSAAGMVVNLSRSE